MSPRTESAAWVSAPNCVFAAVHSLTMRMQLRLRQILPPQGELPDLDTTQALLPLLLLLLSRPCLVFHMKSLSQRTRRDVWQAGCGHSLSCSLPNWTRSSHSKEVFYLSLEMSLQCLKLSWLVHFKIYSVHRKSFWLVVCSVQTVPLAVPLRR